MVNYLPAGESAYRFIHTGYRNALGEKVISIRETLFYLRLCKTTCKRN